MKVTWLGQAGLLFQSEAATVLIDPYLSDSCFRKNPASRRRMPIDPAFLALKPDILVITHAHLDHLDPDTLVHYLGEPGSITVLAPENAWQQLRSFGNGHNYVQFNAGTIWSEKGLTFRAVKAAHSDPTAIGAILSDGRKNYYITGDTLFNLDVAAQIDVPVDAVFLPINGRGCNMNCEDAQKFCRKLHAGAAVPLHWGMFDAVDPHTFCYENRIIPQLYRQIPL